MTVIHQSIQRRKRIVPILVVMVLTWTGTAWAQKGTAADATKASRTVLAQNERYRVESIVYATGVLGLEVRDSQGKVVWGTQPSSLRVKVSLPYNRIAVFTKLRNSGRLDEGKQGQMRGAILYSLDGKTIGSIPESARDGDFHGPIFVTQGTATAAYDSQTAKFLWKNEGIRYTWSAPCGADFINFRFYDSGKNEFVNSICSSKTGKVVYTFTTPRDRDGKILACQGERFVTLQLRDDANGASYESEIRSTKGVLATIRWSGVPLAACFSPDRKSFAAICWYRETIGSTPIYRHTLEVYGEDGKRTTQKNLMKTDVNELLDVTIRFLDGSIVTTLTKKTTVTAPKK